MGISTTKLKIFTFNGSMYCAKNECNTMIIAPRGHPHPSSGANRPSDVAVTVYFNAEFNLMPVYPIIEMFSSNLIPEYCQGLEASVACTAPASFVKSLHGRSNTSLRRLLLHIHADDMFSTILVSPIYIGLCFPKALNPHLTPGVGNVQCVTNRGVQEMGGHSGDSQLHPAQSCMSVQAGKSDTPQ